MSLRRRAFYTLSRVIDEGAYANLALKQATNDLSAADANWLSALVYETLDHLLLIDYILAHFVSASPKRQIRNILRLGCCELLYFSTPAHAAIAENVNLTKEIGKGAQSGFVNAVLRRIDRERDALPQLPSDPIERLSIQYSYPRWLVAEWCVAYGHEFTEALLSSPPAATEVRAQFPFSTEDLLSSLPVKVKQGTLDKNSLALTAGIDIASLPLFQEGKMTVQSQSAMLVCRAAGNCKNKKVLDACAAPGGKSAYLASLAENQIDLTCLEVHAHRTELIKKTFERLHVQANVIRKDASEYDAQFDAAFDIVLLDVPCSGLGLLHDKPDIRYQKNDTDITALVQIQKDILNTCAGYVKPSGVLIYATCTISERENKAQIKSFLKEHAAFALETLPLPLENDGMIQLFPNVHHTDGFFIARMKRCN